MSITKEYMKNGEVIWFFLSFSILAKDLDNSQVY